MFYNSLLLSFAEICYIIESCICLFSLLYFFIFLGGWCAFHLILHHQSDQPVHKVTDRCHLVLDSGRLVDPVREKRLEFHFNAMLDAVAQWRELGKPDRSLLGKAGLILTY